MSKDALKAALSVSLEEMEAEETSGDLLETLVQEANDLTPEQYVEDRIAVEQDIQLIDAQADQLNDAVEVSHEQLDSAIALVNAVAGRYNGFKLKSTGLEGFGDAKERVAPTVAQLRELSVGLESALNVTLESYSVKDMWDHLGILNREIPNMNDRIAVLKNYDGKTKISMHGLQQIFTVDGEIAQNLAKAASDTATIVDGLLKAGEEAISVAAKAAQIAYNTDWSDENAADKALHQIAAMNNVAKTVYDKFDETFTMGYRKLNVKKFNIKGAEGLGNWAYGASLNVSWPKATKGAMVASLFGSIGAGVYMVVTGSSKRNIEIPEMVNALTKLKDVATKSASVRSNAPKKWRDHETLVKKLKADVRGGPQAKVAVRLISELDRLGWECMNGGFTVLYFIVRGLNDAADAITRSAKKR
jgi:hypothetical protein